MTKIVLLGLGAINNTCRIEKHDAMEPDDIRTTNYLTLKEIVDRGLEQAASVKDPQEAKGILIDIQEHFRGLPLFRDDREELYNRLQEAFTSVNSLIENNRRAFREEADRNYREMKVQCDQALALFDTETGFRTIWDRLIEVQTEIRERKMDRENRMALLERLQDGFTLIRSEREAQQKKFESEASAGYFRIKPMAEEGLKLASETHEYKETREFLKKIRNELREARMTREQREELSSKLQTAFDILGKRLDEFFRTKKKNWMTKMNYTLARFDAENFELDKAIRKEEEFLEKLSEQLEIQNLSGKDGTGASALEARIASVRASIEAKQRQIIRNETERNELRAKLEE